MTVAIKTENLTRVFGNFTAVNNLSMELEEGGVYAFLGSNGSGKSTTIRMLSGLLLPTSGSGTILGHDILTESESIKKKIGYVSQKFSLYTDLTVYENLDFYGGLYELPKKERKERIEYALDLIDIRKRQNELVENLSGGWRQKLALACAILHKPKLLFLDEATSGADPNTRRLFWQLIYQFAAEGTTVLITTHFLDEAEHCDNLAFIHNGTLIALDTPKKLKKTIPGNLYKIKSSEPVFLLDELKDKNMPVYDIYIHGKSVIVRLDKEYVSLLSEYKIEKIIPSLEDVFIYLVEQGRAKVGMEAVK